MSNIMLLSTLVDMDDPGKVLNEIEFLISEITPNLDNNKIKAVFDDFISLFEGKLSGHLACNTKYHNLTHSTDVALASFRLAHSSFVDGRRFQDKHIYLLTIASLFHAAGYIPKKTEMEGTGAKHMLKALNRSIEFIKQYARGLNFSSEDTADLINMVKITEHEIDTTKMTFSSLEVELLSKVLGVGEIIGPFANRTFIEKLEFLYEEYKEGMNFKYKDELELINKLIAFYDNLPENLGRNYSCVNKLMTLHFKNRWNIDTDLYEIAMSNNMTYLKEIIKTHGADFKKHLNRGSK